MSYVSESKGAEGTAPPSSILIPEEALRTLEGGHWFEYIKTIADECRGRGDRVTVVAHQDVSPEIVERVQAIPFFKHSAWDSTYSSSSPLKRYFGAALHNARLYRSMSRFFKSQPFHEHVFVPTILIHHIVAWALLARRFRKRKFYRTTLFFVHGQGKYRGPAKPAVFPRSIRNLLFRSALRSLGSLVKEGSVVLAAETEGMAREYSRFCGIRFQCFPHPVRFELSPGMPRKREASPLTMACLGFGRHEKGTDLLQDAILRIRREEPDLKIRFLVQWLNDFDRPDGSRVTKDSRLAEDPLVEFITEPFDPDSYHACLNRIDAMVLPYRARSYYARVSRVALEAAFLGIPLLYTKGTWLDEMVGAHGGGVGFNDEDLDDLTAGILHLAHNISFFQAQAISRMTLAQEHYSPRRFRECLLNETSPAPALTPQPTMENMEAQSNSIH